MLVVKTHAFTKEKEEFTEVFNRAILLIREPLGALKVSKLCIGEVVTTPVQCATLQPQAQFNLLYAGHVGHANKYQFEAKWDKYLSSKLEKWVNFHLFWHGSFHNGTVNAESVHRKPQDLLVVRYSVKCV